MFDTYGSRNLFTVPGSPPDAVHLARDQAQVDGLDLGSILEEDHGGGVVGEDHHRRAAVDQVELRFLDVGEKQSLLQGRIMAPAAGRLLVLAGQSRELEDNATLSYLESLTVPLVLVA